MITDLIFLGGTRTVRGVKRKPRKNVHQKKEAIGNKDDDGNQKTTFLLSMHCFLEATTHLEKSVQIHDPRSCPGNNAVQTCEYELVHYQSPNFARKTRKKLT